MASLQRSRNVAHSTPHRHYREPSRLAKAVARKLSLAPGTIEQGLHGHSPTWPERFYALLEGAFEVGDTDRAADLLAPIYECLAKRFPGQCTEEVEVAELRAGHVEDERGVLYLQQRTAERAAARIAAIDGAVFQLLRKRAALRNEWGLSA